MDKFFKIVDTNTQRIKWLRDSEKSKNTLMEIWIDYPQFQAVEITEDQYWHEIVPQVDKT